MGRFVVGDDRGQSTLFPERLEDYLAEDNPVRAIDVFVDELDLAGLGFGGVAPEVTGRPAYHPATLLKIYVYGYLNRVQSSRRLERECQRNIELVWLTGRLMPDFKTIADFRKDNGEAIRKVCREFVVLCRRLELFGDPMGVHIQVVTAAKAEDFDAAFQTMGKERAEALIVLVNPMFFGQRKEIVERAVKQRLPSMYEWKPFVQAGGLISYGADVPDVYRRAAGIVDKILKGTKPGDIAVERPVLFNMGVNLRTAKALGVTIPDRIRKQAVEIVE
jgi:transposase